ncbi:MAG: hypothetical protein IJV87_02255 [Clostridia bacterium]|nr:hypothetical protein [Clostridia bacterium]
MKKHIQKIAQITVASLISTIIYVFTIGIVSMLLQSVAGDFMNASGILWITSLLFVVVFSLSLINTLHRKNDNGEKIALEDYKTGYIGIINDIKLLFKREFNLLYYFLFINGVCWIITYIDKLISAKKTFSAIFLIYYPLNCLSVVLPTWLNSVLAYALGSILCYAIYLLTYALVRKKWHKKWTAKEK